MEQNMGFPLILALSIEYEQVPTNMTSLYKKLYKTLNEEAILLSENGHFFHTNNLISLRIEYGVKK